MFRRRALALLLISILALPLAAGAPAHAMTPPVSPAGDVVVPSTTASTLSRSVTARLDTALLEGWGGLPGGAVAGVWVPGRGKWVGSVGLADIETGRPMVPRLQIPIGSATKPFTGTLVLQEVEAGRLSLDDRLSQWYPEIDRADEITVAMLLNMSSGIADYANGDIVGLITTLLADPKKQFRPDDLIAKGAAMPRAFEVPGSSYSYSNTNVVILGRILEKTTGVGYESLLQSRLFGPLGLTRTFLDLDGELAAPHAQTYSEVFSIDPEGPPIGETTDWSISWAWSAGALASTIRDLRDWGRTLGTGAGALSPATAALRLTDCVPITATATIASDYCLGLVADRSRDTGEVVTLWHNGQVFGAVSYIGYYPATGAVVAVQANSDLTDADDQSAATRVRAAIEAAIPGLLGVAPGGVS
jgi:D-alanyl-D-alanine carboxypeptidase